MDVLVDLLVVALATWQAVEICHHGSIFAEWRAVAETRGWFIDDLFLCPFCLSVWMAAVMFILTNANQLKMDGFPGNIVFDAMRLPVWAFAASRLANLMNDVNHDVTRTPEEEDIINNVGDN